MKKLNEDLSQTINEAECEFNNKAKELKAKVKELDDAKIALKAKEKELEDVTSRTKVKSLEQSIYALKKRKERELKALQAAYKKADDISKYMISKKNQEIEKKDSTINMQEREIERLQQQLSKAKTHSMSKRYLKIYYLNLNAQSVSIHSRNHVLYLNAATAFVPRALKIPSKRVERNARCVVRE